ncbi:MAG TPA: nuclear transport factor 2 family protein [Acidimicrobiia bacterium]|jgi:ketosteroid isomerase-like protein|nr:nuclear transport factor 2 family protein [Acidimicrobiia bacterium]
MADHRNASLYRQVFESGDYADAISDDVEWWDIGSWEPIRGKAAFIEQRQETAGLWQITSRLHDVIANDTHVIALIEAKVERDGQTLDYREAEIMHVRDGKFTHRWALGDDTAAIARFFAT